MIIVTVRAATVEEARRQVAGLGPGAEGVEIRLDDLAGQEWHGLVSGSRLPVIATCRPRFQEGGFSGSEAERLVVLREALAAGAAWVDLESGSEAETLVPELPPERVILSLHEFEPGVATLAAQANRLFQAPAGVTLKLAFTPRRVSDCLHGRQMLARAAEQGRRLVLVPMGEAGQPGRILACAWGSRWTYAAPDGATPAAPGQLPLREMADLYDVAGIGPDTKLTGILGWPVAASLSPWMHNRAARDAGLDARYLPFPERDAADFMINVRAWPLLGASVTHPHKEVVLPWLDELSAAARGCGSVNTLSFGVDRVRGENTDAPAALAAICAALPGDRQVAGLRLGILGAGGAARAVAWATRGAGARVTLYNRDRRRGRAVARALGVSRMDLGKLTAGETDVLVNATPVGAWPQVHEVPVSPDLLGGDLVLDLVSCPRETRLVRAARERGLAACNGIGMLVRQGEAQYRLWHGVAPPPGAFHAAALEGLRWQERSAGPESISGYNGVE
jgi:3-dehydroquinate dehydratase/shikimate dehydrogenase